MRRIDTYERYFLDFYESLGEKEQEKIQKKTQKTPRAEIELAKQLRRAYYESK